MTNEEAKEILSDVSAYLASYSKLTNDTIAGHSYLDICRAITILKSNSDKDCISRQAVDELSKELVHTTRDKADFLCNFWEGLRKLPPVTPKPKTGHWIDGDRTRWKCSNCGYGVLDWNNTPYCPKCGAKMEESEGKE